MEQLFYNDSKRDGIADVGEFEKRLIGGNDDEITNKFLRKSQAPN